MLKGNDNFSNYPGGIANQGLSSSNLVGQAKQGNGLN
jgi:hypothetical protein